MRPPPPIPPFPHSPSPAAHRTGRVHPRHRGQPHRVRLRPVQAHALPRADQHGPAHVPQEGDGRVAPLLRLRVAAQAPVDSVPRGDHPHLPGEAHGRQQRRRVHRGALRGAHDVRAEAEAERGKATEFF